MHAPEQGPLHNPRVQAILHSEIGNGLACCRLICAKWPNAGLGGGTRLEPGKKNEANEQEEREKRGDVDIAKLFGSNEANDFAHVARCGLRRSRA